MARSFVLWEYRKASGVAHDNWQNRERPLTLPNRPSVPSSPFVNISLIQAVILPTASWRHDALALSLLL